MNLCVLISAHIGQTSNTSPLHEASSNDSDSDSDLLGKLGNSTKLNELLETLRHYLDISDEEDDNTNDNDDGVRSHGNRNDVARDKFVDIFTVI